MRTTILAALAALLALASSPVHASFTQDDRYFDTRIVRQDVHKNVRKNAHRRVRQARHRARNYSTKTVLGPRLKYHKVAWHFPPYAGPEVGDSRTVVLGGRPSGCPHAFCGCGASIHLFGRIIPFLNLAANWLRFPRALPAPKMAAARQGHVFVLEHHISGNLWMVFDANSGRHMSRMHPRSIAGYTIVNPRAGPS